MTEVIFEELRRYVGFDPSDARLMAEFHAAAAPHFERIAHEFYDRIRGHEQAFAVLKSEAEITRLQKSLVAWLHRVCAGVYDEAYAKQTAKIGRVHVRVGLPQRYMFTAMALIRVALMRIADEYHGPRAQPGGPARILRHQFPIGAVSGAPDFVGRRVVRHSPIVPPAHVPHLVLENERHRQVAVLPRRSLLNESPCLAIR